MISILISTLNPIEEFFKKSLDSVFAQTYQDFEIIIVDDGSDVPVLEFLRKYKYDMQKIKYKRLEHNVGTPKALNIGLKMCEGEYIAKIDDDDIMHKDRLEKQLRYVEMNNLSGCFSWYYLINKEGINVGIKKIYISQKKYMKQLLSKGNIFCHSTMFIKKVVLDEINGYDENLRYAQDCELYVRILEIAKIGMINEPLIDYRINDYRNNKYRETLSLTYALFSVVKHLTTGKNVKRKEYFYAISRVFRYCIGIIKIIIK